MRYVTTTVTCDIPGEHSGEIRSDITLELAGEEKEIDLCEGHAREVAQALASFITWAHRVDTVPREYVPRRSMASRQRARDIRAWALDNGVELSSRGRIPGSVIVKWAEAQKSR